MCCAELCSGVSNCVVVSGVVQMMRDLTFNKFECIYIYMRERERERERETGF